MTTETLRERITGILDPIKTNPPIRWDILLEEQCNDILDLIRQEKIAVLEEEVYNCLNEVEYFDDETGVIDRCAAVLQGFIDNQINQIKEGKS